MQRVWLQLAKISVGFLTCSWSLFCTQILTDYNSEQVIVQDTPHSKADYWYTSIDISSITSGEKKKDTFLNVQGI